MLQLSDYFKASLDNKCTTYDVRECTNRNYLSNVDFNTWLLTSVAENTYEVYYLNEIIYHKKASSSNKVYPVIYLSSDIILSEGDGSFENMYKLK